MTTTLGTITVQLQQTAAFALADLLQRTDLPDLDWCVPRRGAGVLVGVHDHGELPARITAVDAWAVFLGASTAWKPFGDGGEYVAEAVHLGARVTVRAWLPEAPCLIESQP